MENILKLPSQQSLFNQTNNLVDIVIPSDSGVYSLVDTYIAIVLKTDNIELDTSQAAAGQLPKAGARLPASSAVADLRLGFKHNPTGNSLYENTAVPIETLVRDCSMFSSTKGKIEDIRRSDTLRATRKAYLQDMSDVQSAALVGGPGFAQTNPWSSGGFAQLVGVGSVESRYRSHEVRIYLKDLFNIAQADEWDTSVYGSLSLHLELNTDRLIFKQNLGNAAPNPWDLLYHDVSSGRYEAAFKTAELKIVAVPAAVSTEDGILMGPRYESLDDVPHWVNQLVKVTTTITVPASATAGTFYPASGEVRWGVISEIDWDKTTKQVTLKFGDDTLEIPAITGTGSVLISRTVEGVDVTAASLAIANMTYQSIELTAVRSAAPSGPSQIQYTQYQTQQDQFASATNLTRSYYLPAQTTNCIIVLPDGAGGTGSGSDLLGCARLTDYRFSINGETVTNRPVQYMSQATINAATVDAKCDAGSALHYDLISRTFLNQGQRFHSLKEAVFDQVVPESTARAESAGVVGWANLSENPEKRCYMLSLPIPTSNTQTQLTIELNGQFVTDAGRVLIYSEVQSII